MEGPKFFVGILQVFSNKNATTLNITALFAYSFLVVLMNVFSQISSMSN